jgi:threonine synthase
MQFVSTRGGAERVRLSAALSAGLAPDGGLYLPARWPQFEPSAFADEARLPQIAQQLLAPLFAGDALAAALPEICAQALAIDAPLRALPTPGDWVLELFHGPTAAFKDFAARFLAACLLRINPAGETRELQILVATSGDTGAAVGAAFASQPGVRVWILYPDGRVSPRQAHQLGAFGGNVTALRVQGNFDDCQALVKRALNDNALAGRLRLSSANSISLGRLLPQMSYYAQASLSHWRTHARPLGFIVPTGNLGNALAALLAQRMGLPIGEIVLATNANPTVSEFFAGNDYAPRPGVATLANAMDVGAPSNFERLRALYASDAEVRAALSAEQVDDAQIRAAIGSSHARYGTVVCPHTACALVALERRRAAGDSRDYAVVATAHPAKFDTVLAPLIDVVPEPPPALAALLQQPSQSEALANDYAAFSRRLIAG